MALNVNLKHLIAVISLEGDDTAVLSASLHGGAPPRSRPKVRSASVGQGGRGRG